MSKLEAYGANHLGPQVGAYEPKNFLGSGQLINGAHPKTNNLRTLSPEQQRHKSDAIYSGPIGSHLGAGRILPDGTLDRSASNPALLNQAPLKPEAMQYGSFVENGQYNNGPRIAKYKGLKAEANTANGGIGVTYSNVVLGAGGAPNIDTGVTNYSASFGKGRMSQPPPQQQVLSVPNNYSHKNRFVNNNSGHANNNSVSNNEISYVKGVDFNSQQKYDFNILNNMPTGNGQAPASALSNAGQRIL